jgi:gamma-glutamyltranspeptidase/glutathione hydrolase
MLQVRVYVPIAVIVFTLCGASMADESIGWQAQGAGGAVAAGRAGSVAAGITILEQGGNAADAAAAAVLALSVTDYGSFAFGGEVPLIIYDAKRREVKALSGQGEAPRDPNAIKWYYEHGIPTDLPLKAAAVPAAPSLIITTLKLYGTMKLEQIAAPTLKLLDDGNEPWQKGMAKTLRLLIDTEQKTDGTREQKLQAARDRFYKGDIAEQLDAYYVKNGGLLRKADLVAHVTRVEEPVAAAYRGYRVYKCGPWTQGPYLCETLELLEGFDLKEMGHLSPQYIHVVVESLKLGLADRDMYYGDPLFVKVPLEGLLSPQYTALRRGLIDPNKASAAVRPGDPVGMKALKEGGTYQPWPGGTTTCVVADRWGNMVAATPSGNPAYGTCEELGISHATRLTSFNTTPGHPNRIEPGKRPRITLTPTIVLRDGKAVMAISVGGGDLQDQTTLNCFLNLVEFGMLPAKAVEAPRFSTGHHQDSFEPNPDRTKTYVGFNTITVDERIGMNVQSDLKASGHIVKTSAEHIGTPVMIYRDPNTAMIYAAGDAAQGRHAAAIQAAGH